MNKLPHVLVPSSLPGITIDIAHYHPNSSDHRPGVTVQLHHDQRNIHLHFTVHDDRYIVAKRTALQDPVYRDACVEMFIQPVRPDGSTHGYCNFEFSATGAMLSYHIFDHRRAPGGFVGFTKLSHELAKQVRVTPSLKRLIEVEEPGPMSWSIDAVVPVSVLEACVGPLGNLGGQRWRANFQKCADDSSHPHWATWSPIGEVLEFHAPEKFGEIEFVV